MQLTSLSLAVFLGLATFSPSVVRAMDREPMPAATEKAILKYFKAHLYLGKYSEVGREFGDYFKGVEVYQLWKEDAKVEGEHGVSATGMGYVLVRGGSAQVYDDDTRMFSDLVKTYRGKLDSADDVEKLFRVLGPVIKVEAKGGGQYEVISKKFFEDLSGFNLSVKDDGSVRDCRYVSEFKK